MVVSELFLITLGRKLCYDGVVVALGDERHSGMVGATIPLHYNSVRHQSL